MYKMHSDYYNSLNPPFISTTLYTFLQVSFCIGEFLLFSGFVTFLCVCVSVCVFNHYVTTSWNYLLEPGGLLSGYTTEDCRQKFLSHLVPQ